MSAKASERKQQQIYVTESHGWRKGGSGARGGRGGERCRRLRVILLGDAKVGKTSLLHRFVRGTFDDDVHRTIAIKETEKEVVVDSKRHVLRVVDTMGGSRFLSLRCNSYPGTHICLLIFALDNLTSFCNLTQWREEFFFCSGVTPDIEFPFLVIGNKSDVSPRAVSELNVQAWCRANGDVPYFETSAKQALNVEEVFQAAVRRFYEVDAVNVLTPSTQKSGSVINLRNETEAEGEQSPRSKCCI